MKLIDDLFDLYKNHLTDDEEDVIVIIEDVMNDFKEEDIKKMMAEFSDEERKEMLGLYMYEKFRLKIAQEGLKRSKYYTKLEDGSFLH